MKIGREAKLLIAFFLLCGAAAVLLSREASDESAESFFPRRSTYRSAPDGMRALYLTLKRLDFPVHRWRRVMVREQLPASGVFVVTGALVPIAETEWRALADWVADGNTLLVCADLQLPLAAPFDARLRWVEDGTRSARPCQPSFLARSIRRIAVEESPRLALQAVGESVFRGLIPMFKDPAGAVVGYAEHGRGRVVLVAGGYAFSNEAIGRADNILLAVNALSGPEGGRPAVYFDEYHQGYGEVVLWQFVTGRAKIGLAVIGLAILVLLFAKSRRFGAPLPAPDMAGRQRSEYLSSMTALLQRGRAARLAMRASYGRVLERLRDRYGLAGDARPAEVAAAAQAHSDPAGGEVAGVVEECEAALAAPHLDEQTALRLVRRLDRAMETAHESRG
ncbi:hypothetical protein AMK68_01320 [candidate division KD3-62 bacterium DG_56]|uniref:DUF4350 domain-containing protein n=1 Tax=candidate division KD3-62 bacterium DG_56 TaxID=1704032 RepID=A0A0S7XQR6_9BACT|nr:MAG: hypothetical protein AMK68_01320 [candidate division KD3-62 bacterium DG_56]